MELLFLRCFFVLDSNCRCLLFAFLKKGMGNDVFLCIVFSKYNSIVYINIRKKGKNHLHFGERDSIDLFVFNAFLFKKALINFKKSLFFDFLCFLRNFFIPIHFSTFVLLIGNLCLFEVQNRWFMTE